MYGTLDKLPPALSGGVNPDLLVRITLEEVNLDKFNPPYNGPAVVVRVRQENTTETIVDRIIEIRKDDVTPFSNPPETMEEALARRKRDVSTRVAHYLEAFGVTREQLATTANATSFASWCEGALALLPEGYDEKPVAILLTFLKNGMLWTPRYLKGKGYGPFVNTDPSKLRVMQKHVVVPPIQSGDGEPAVSPAAPW